MFSLKAKNKNNQAQQQGQNPNKDKSQKQQHKNTNKAKPQSKKVSKTVFEDPFYYRIQLLPQQQSTQVITLLTAYITKLRQSMPHKPPRQGLKMMIKFEPDKNIKQKQSPLISPQIIMGIKRTKMSLYNYYKKKEEFKERIPHLTLIFYQQKKHQILMELLCLLKVLNLPYLLIRDSLEVNRLLGVRTVGSLCLFNEQFSNNLLKYIGKCLIDIPWVIQIDKIINTIKEE